MSARRPWVCHRQALVCSIALIVGAIEPGHASCASTNGLARGYEHLADIRRAAGLLPLARQPALELAARDHAAYLAEHRTTSHEQSRGRRGFTGETPSDRALARGYRGSASENVSYGHPDLGASIDGLMAAIYHRLNFLDFERDEIGIAACREEGSEAYAYSLGATGLAALCARPARTTTGSFVRGLCAKDRRLLAARDVDEWRAVVTNRSPDVVVWPPPGEIVAPAFFEEIPDPLPDRSVSGYPVSFQAHPGRFERLVVEHFELTSSGDAAVGPLRTLDVETDPHGKLSTREWVVFPLQRLAWDTDYRVEAVVRVDGERRAFDWSFRTAAPDGELLELDQRMPYHVIEPGVQYAIYAPPPTFHRLADGVSWRYPAGVELETRFQDGNTLVLTVHGRACAPIELRLEDGTHRLDPSAASGC